jgi:sulfur-carrier protein adenylyltransferase/sulfurtransferase
VDARVSAFRFSRAAIDATSLRGRLADPACGACASFEGWVRDHNEGRRVTQLTYEAFEPLAIKEGERILAEAVARFGIEHAECIHRIGTLGIGELAVWVGVSSRHRDEAFRACRYIIDEVKHRVPIWKKEQYADGDSGWVNCERCAEAAPGVGDQASDVQAEPDYSRQMALKEVGPAGQAKLRAARVLVVGAGGLGVPVLQYLAGAGIGRIDIVDGDVLEPSNLHRQTLYALGDVGRPKARLAAQRLGALNPEVDVRAHTVRLDAQTAEGLVADADLAIDCTDNFSTKFLLNDVCVRLGKPAILASVYQYEGQLQIVSGAPVGACLRCVWPEATRDGLVGNCAEAGVLGPVPGVFGSLQALEALRMLLGLPRGLDDELLIIDLLTLTTRRMKIRRATECAGRACARAASQAARAVPPAADIELTFPSLDAALECGLEIMDVREARELEQTPTPAARYRHVPLGALLQGEPPSSGSRWLLVCASGTRSLAAVHELRARGAVNVYSLRYGLRGLQPPAH